MMRLSTCQEPLSILVAFLSPLKKCCFVNREEHVKRIGAMIAVTVGLTLGSEKFCSLQRADNALLKCWVLPSTEYHCQNKRALTSLVFQ